MIVDSVASTRIVPAATILDIVDRAAVRRAVERAHAELSRGTATVTLPTAVKTATASLLPMAAAIESSGVGILKAVIDVSQDGGHLQNSIIILCSLRSGECEAILDGRTLTAIRTAAASAVATQYLARPDSATLGLIGAGNLAYEHARALTDVIPFRRILVWSRQSATIERLRARVAEVGLSIEIAPSPESVVRESDVVCTLTPSRDPIVRGEWFHPGLHINAVGAPPDARHREIDGPGMAGARLVVDSITATLSKSGDTVLAIADGSIDRGMVDVELGDVITGAAPGRRSADDVTLFNSVGLALQDAAAIETLLDAVRALPRVGEAC